MDLIDWFVSMPRVFSDIILVLLIVGWWSRE